MNKRIVTFLMAVVLFLSGIPVTAQAAAERKKANIRFVFTTDLHGQLTSANYEAGGEYNIGGLSRAYTLIEKARKEKGKENTFTFDLGDTMYDYTTEYIYMEEPEAIQPIYKAMKTIGYDAITLGNHDFDYGYSYIKNQIKGSGLSNICVVSNVTDANTKKHVWKENMLISRKVKASDGTAMTVKVGVIGETIPKLSPKTESYTAVLNAEDILENVEKQAKALKRKGADVVVVLSHSGMGEETPEYLDKNTSYALSKIKEVDVVLCGHNHINFPSEDVNAKNFYKLPKVDKKTGLVNGKNVVMCSDRGKGIGVADLTVEKSGSGVKISKRKSEVRLVADKKPAVNKDLNENYMGKWENIFQETMDNEVGRLPYGERLENFFGLLEDSKAIELVNEAKIAYGLNYIYNINPSYKDYPVIAAANYKSFGQEDASDYLDIRENISEAELSRFQAYNAYTNIYTITGAQLREWVEWTASAYAEGGVSDNKGHDYLNSSTLLSAEWQNDWAGTFIFDGIEYEINTLAAPRYSRNGSKISNSRRVTSLTRNGVEIEDKDQFILVTDRITGMQEVMKELKEQAVYGKYNRSQVILMDYLLGNFKGLELPMNADHNWKLVLNPESVYRIESGIGSEAFAREKEWYRGTAGSQNEYMYFDGSFNNLNKDEHGPLVVAKSLNERTTNKNVKIAVHANDPAGVKKIAYLEGRHKADAQYMWDAAKVIEGNAFEADTNGTYSIMAEDNLGNRNVTYIVINNINRGTLEAPRVETYTNRKTKIRGTAEPGTHIYFETGTSRYEAQVDEYGRFSFALPSQEAGAEVITYVKDTYGRTSEKLCLKVKRTGPNYPEIEELANNQTKIRGNLNDSHVKPVLLIGSRAYMSEQDIPFYKASEIYEEKYSIAKTKVSVDSQGSFTMDIPAQRNNTKIKMYMVDSAGRASRMYKSSVLEAAPNKPGVYAATNVEKKIFGHVYHKDDGKSFDILIQNGNSEYRGTTDEKGYFEIPTGTLKKDDVVKVYAFDTGVDGRPRKSAAGTITVKDVNSYIGDGDLTLNNLTDKVTVLKGSSESENETIYLKIGSKTTEVTSDSDGNFRLELSEALSVGTNVYAVTRYEKGSVADAAKITVKKGVPFQPVIYNEEIYNNTMTLLAESEENCSLYAMIDGKKYTAGKYKEYDEENEVYQYEIKIPKTNSGEEVTVYAENSAGKSKSAKAVIVENAPDTPKVKTATEKTKKITGIVHLILPKDMETEELPTATNTKTKVFAKIGSKEYEAEIKEDGSFTIKIPKQKKKTKITIWAMNENGTGPKKTITVK